MEKIELELLQLITDYSKEKKQIDQHYVDRFFEFVIPNKSLQDYIKEVSWVPYLKEKNAIAAYTLHNKIEISESGFNNLIKEKNQYDSYFNQTEKYLYRLLRFTSSLLHETEHAMQDQMDQQNTGDFETNLIRACLEIPQDLLLQYYNQNPRERLAKMRALKTINTILKNIKGNLLSLCLIQKDRMQKETIKGYILENDLVYCPTEIFLTNTGIQNKLTWFQFDFFDMDRDKMVENVSATNDLQKRLTYGLPISQSEYKNITKHQ
ncbi:MAG: hypothetical protein PHN72_00870 [Bacilli bacterium]|nr:hypothetical protein [Bacilli bacterium]